MSFRDPNEFARARQDASGPPYDQAKQALSQSEAEIENQAGDLPDPGTEPEGALSKEEKEQRAEDLLAEVGKKQTKND